MKAVIFDVDGTLYDQRKLRMRMLFDMVLSALRNPAVIREIRMVWHFRKERERRQFTEEPGIGAKQYEWASGRCGVPAEQVRQAVETWMFEKPLPCLSACRYTGVREMFVRLSQKQVAVGIFSDYRADEKLQALGLRADVIVSADDPGVDRLKPDPRGLIYTAERLGVAVNDCLFIGDRQDKDGRCARAAGMRFFLFQPNPDGFHAPLFQKEVNAWIHGS